MAERDPGANLPFAWRNWTRIRRHRRQPSSAAVTLSQLGPSRIVELAGARQLVIQLKAANRLFDRLRHLAVDLPFEVAEVAQAALRAGDAVVVGLVERIEMADAQVPLVIADDQLHLLHVEGNLCADQAFGVGLAAQLLAGDGER